jgi:hypothetical protein
VAQLAGTGTVFLGLLLIGADGLVSGAASNWVGDLIFVGAGLLLAGVYGSYPPLAACCRTGDGSRLGHRAR